MADEFNVDDDFLEVLTTSAITATRAAPERGPHQARGANIQQPTPQKIQRPITAQFDRPPPTSTSSSSSKVIQPTPQALPQRTSGSSILVSPRQRGNPVLANIRSVVWEYSDIPADYVIGLTTCALFLSLKYHRLHPEYIYTRIRNLQGKYNLRILLTLVDIPNHEDPLRELSKTSLVNNVTVILCWSATEAARYLELFKSYEHANYSAIRGQQASTYAEKLVEFVTVPRSVNKTDAVSLVSNFGSLKNAINADPEQIGIIGGWGGVKVKRWCAAIDEPFRSLKAKKRKINSATSKLPDTVPISLASSHNSSSKRRQDLQESVTLTDSATTPVVRRNPDTTSGVNTEPMEAVDERPSTVPSPVLIGDMSSQRQRRQSEELNDGIAAALAKLRNQT